jgi:hypothetical protein
VVIEIGGSFDDAMTEMKSACQNIDDGVLWVSRFQLQRYINKEECLLNVYMYIAQSRY